MRPISLVITEGQLEVPTAQKIFAVLGLPIGEARFISKGGRHAFWGDAPRYSAAAAQVGPILGLADLEAAPCPSGLISDHLPHGLHPAFILRVAERMLESWLLADRDRIAEFLHVPRGRVPGNPDALSHPKQELVNLARQSRRRHVIDDLVPPQGSSGVVGRGYTSRMAEFIRSFWRPLDAQHNSESLRRALAAIQAATV